LGAPRNEGYQRARLAAEILASAAEITCEAGIAA
jgi:hypothetical protein